MGKRGMNHYERLLACLGDAQAVVIQPHDFPDHDAVAAAFGLCGLLRLKGYSPRILHRGRVRSHSLLAMVSELGITLERIRDVVPGDLEDVPCIIVDACPSNSNARPLTRRLLGVIDHHPNPGDFDCPFIDIRSSYGAAATLISEYWLEAGLSPDRNTATALLMGIQMDTDFLGRRVSPADLDAHHRLFFQADWEFGTRTVRASLSLKDLDSIHEAVARSHSQGSLFFTTIPRNCTQELISILADFFLRLKEISVTAIVELGGDQYHVSVRSRSPDLSAAYIAKTALTGLGPAGGHDHMAGGKIDPALCPDEQVLFRRFVDAVEGAEENR